MNILSKKILTPVLALFGMSLFSAHVFADDWSKLNAKKQTKLGLYLTAKQADEFVQKNMSKTLFVDIRTPGELVYLGTPSSIDAAVPFEFMDTSKWDDKKHVYKHVINKDFVAGIDARMTKKGLSKTDNVILICRSGSRSAKAANMLAAQGYTNAYTVVDGFEGDKAKEGENKGKRTINGWKNSGLSWTYHLDKDLMYFTK